MYHSLPSHLSPPLSIPLSLLCHLSCLSIAYSFIVVTLGAAVCMVCSCVNLLAGLGQYSFSIYVNIYVISLTFFSTILFFFKALLKICSELMTFPNEIWGLEIYVCRQHLVLKQSLDLERPGLFPLPHSAMSELRVGSG